MGSEMCIRDRLRDAINPQYYCQYLEMPCQSPALEDLRSPTFRCARFIFCRLGEPIILIMETLSVHDIKELMHAKHITSAEVSEWLASVEEFAETIRDSGIVPSRNACGCTCGFRTRTRTHRPIKRQWWTSLTCHARCAKGRR